ncbi:BCCT family transporter [Hoyosella rhizosphaerae]|uniref:Multidrug DMT transporter permease n=1 Tax=Hoyosella rhizosphaerae TaxID=1755582 RepID=A0A916U3U6_9ACTN|nr:BCCT family transporter [Hoyosella rhizosphaerae]MBN4926621.1 BCCT family transporter [Hoyosella rhizosphaerae]GGC57850.1 multidrug DMT transporter permease [Hoyosella rhizosphaerae]
MLKKAHDRMGLRTDPIIFFVSAGIAIGFVLFAILFTGFVDSVFTAARDWLLTSFGWFYILGVTSFLLFLIWIAFSRYGHVKLGGEDEKPEYSNMAWFSMLFAAGIGTILMFWGVAEPISHYANPPRGDVEPESIAAMDEAMGFTLYHFGLHTWTIFCLPALAFSYFVYKRGLPMRVSSIFYPILGDRIHGPIGKSIDILAVIGTLFGVATSIGLGTLQINSGLNSLFGVPEGKLTQVLLIFGITLIAIGSVVLGLDKGIKRLSNINITMAIGLLVFIFISGATLYLAKGIIETTGTYLKWIVPLSFWTDAADVNPGWQGNWTVFYWAWTITWAPFVGIFIARISRGRTIRQFVGGVLGLPTAFSIIWFSVFGLSSFDIERNRDGNLIQEVVVENDIPGALFSFLENFPFTTFVAAISVLIVVIFFTTSSDSASLVIDMLCTGESGMGPTRQRVFWAALEGVVGATLLAAAAGTDGLTALQQVITVIGLPFFLIGFLMMYNLVKALREDHVSTGDPVRAWKHAKFR